MVARWSYDTKHHREPGIDHNLYCDLFFVGLHFHRKRDCDCESCSNRQCQLYHHLRGTKCNAYSYTFHRRRKLCLVARWIYDTKYYSEPCIDNNIYCDLYFVGLHFHRIRNSDRQPRSNH